jgi:hypothetical protein
MIPSASWTRQSWLNSALPIKIDMLAFEDIKPGSRLRGLDAAGIAEVVQVSRFGADAVNLVFRVNGRVAERLVYRGEETSFELKCSSLCAPASRAACRLSRAAAPTVG